MVAGIIVALPKLEDARSIKNILTKNGFQAERAVTTGAQALAAADEMHDGIVICSYKLADMLYKDIYEDLPTDFEMLLLASPRLLNECDESDIVCLSMPLKVNDLINTVNMLSDKIAYRRKRRRQSGRIRSVEDESLINEAKEILMERNHMTEEEAHHYLQKCSMDSGTNLVEMAQMVLTMMKE